MSNTLFVRGLRLEGGGNKILLYAEVEAKKILPQAKRSSCLNPQALC